MHRRIGLFDFARCSLTIKDGNLLCHVFSRASNRTFPAGIPSLNRLRVRRCPSVSLFLFRTPPFSTLVTRTSNLAKPPRFFRSHSLYVSPFFFSYSTQLSWHRAQPKVALLRILDRRHPSIVRRVCLSVRDTEPYMLLLGSLCWASHS